jgi:hypothetical protein
MCFDTVFAPPKDRLRCTVGLSKTACKIAWMIGCPDEQGADPSPRIPSMVKEQSIALGLGWCIHEDRDW